MRSQIRYLLYEVMKHETKIDLTTMIASLAAVGLVLTGVWWVWPPAALIVAGLVLLQGAKSFHDRRKKR